MKIFSKILYLKIGRNFKNYFFQLTKVVYPFQFQVPFTANGIYKLLDFSLLIKEDYTVDYNYLHRFFVLRNILRLIFGGLRAKVS